MIGPPEPGLMWAAQGLGITKGLPILWVTRLPDSHLWTSPVFLTLCPLTWDQTVQDSLIILRYV